MKKILLFFLWTVHFCPLFGQQISGTVYDLSNKEPIIAARIESSENQITITNFDGQFKLRVDSLPVTITVSMSGFEPQKLVINSFGEKVQIFLSSKDLQTGTVVISASRRQQGIEEVPMSMDVLKADYLDSKGFSNLEDAVESTPGVTTMDGQVSIRGGSGYAYGVGSRVMLLWNGLPLLSGDAGDIKFNTLPVENTSQIEVIKGASSVLYGSGALNGVVALTEREPKLDGEFRIKVQSAVYDKPSRASLQWYNNTMRGVNFADLYYGKMYRNFGFSISASTFNDDGYREGEIERRTRVGGMFYIRPEKFKNLKAGIGYNFQYQFGASFLIWESDSLAFTPRGGADITNPESTLVLTRGIRTNIDPYVKVYDKKGNVHDFKSRVYFVDNDVVTDATQANSSTTYTFDYQYQKKIDSNGTFTTGAFVMYADARAKLFGDHNMMNQAIYAQMDYKFFKKLFVTAGLRAEYFQIDGKYQGDSDFNLFGLKSNIYPVFRTAASYQLAKATFVRASWGQGVRFPSIAERFVQTSVGALNIFPNENLQRETGWAGEIGVKQVVLFDNWKALIDVAGFWNEYNDMIEFQFGVFNPEGTILSLDPTSPLYVGKWIGFKAVNAERARITGLEATITSEGKIGDFELRTLAGYTYTNPISLNNDPDYRSTFSDTTTNMLKYRFYHMIKADVEVIYSKFSAGLSFRYMSFMKNIDAAFQTEVFAGEEILVGMGRYREQFNKGIPVFDARIGYKVNEQIQMRFIINNLLNAEYMSRPGAIQPPRMFMVQAMIHL